MCKVYIGYCGTNEIEHGLCAKTVDNPRAKARGLSPRKKVKVKVSHSLIAVGAVGVRVPLYLGHS